MGILAEENPGVARDLLYLSSPLSLGQREQWKGRRRGPSAKEA